MQAANLARERGLGRSRRRGIGGNLPIVRAYQLSADLAGKTAGQVHSEHGHVPGKLLRIKRGKKLIDVTPDGVLGEGDIVSFIAGTYTFANVLLTFAGALMMVL